MSMIIMATGQKSMLYPAKKQEEHSRNCKKHSRCFANSRRFQGQYNAWFCLLSDQLLAILLKINLYSKNKRVTFRKVVRFPNWTRPNYLKFLFSLLFRFIGKMIVLKIFPIKRDSNSSTCISIHYNKYWWARRFFRPQQNHVKLFQ